MSKERLMTLLEPITRAVSELDLSRADAAEELTRRFPLTSEPLREIATLFETGVSEGWLCEREANGVRFGRVTKANSPAEISIDAVRMNAPGPGHTHPNGEADLCFAVEGDPKFDGRAPGWTVYPAGSWHVPTVRGGTMNILYFLPGGAIRFEPKPSH